MRENCVIRKTLMLTALTLSQAAPIFNGEIAEERKFPFAVSFGFRAENSSSFQHFCGGSIVENDFKFSWAISAAHCFINFKELEIYAIIGSVDLLSDLKNLCRVRKVFMDDYNIYNLQNDIALVQIECPSHYHRPAIEVSSAEPTSVLQCLIYGYGSLKFDIYNAKPSNMLYYGEVDVIGLEQCEDIVGRAIVPMPGVGQFCGRGTAPKKSDACHGDSGSGLICKKSTDTEYKIFGIISYGTNCGSNSVGVYESVAFHRHWIDSILQKQCQIGEEE